VAEDPGFDIGLSDIRLQTYPQRIIRGTILRYAISNAVHMYFQQ